MLLSGCVTAAIAGKTVRSLNEKTNTQEELGVWQHGNSERESDYISKGEMACVALCCWSSP